MLIRRVPLRRTVPPRRSAPPKSGATPRRRVPVRRIRPRPRRGPERCPEYLAWIRTLGCAVCSRVSGESIFVEAAHTNALGPRGMSQKTSDFSAIPLCSAHHRKDSDSYHRLGEVGFAKEHGLNLEEVVRALNDSYRRSHHRAPHSGPQVPVTGSRGGADSRQ